MIALLIALDLWLTLAHPLARLPVASLERSETCQSINSYNRLGSAPDIVLFGSSLMTAPVLQSEALYLHRPIPKFVHRDCHVLDEALARRLGGSPHVFCLASGGEMASDAFLITKNVLSGRRRPAAIIYGIAPRDFQDNLLPGLESTPAFQALSNLGDLPERLQSPSLNFKQKTDLALGRIWALWRYRTDIRVYLTLRLKKYLERALPWVCFEKYDGRHELRRQKRGLFPEEAAGEPTAWPGVALDHISVQQTIEDYNARYNPVSPRLVSIEFDYFERMLRLCRDRDIAVLVVGMPLSERNIGLMEPGFHSRFLDRSRKLCRQYGADFANFNVSPWNDAGNFVDTVHLKPELSASFLDALAGVAARSRVAIALKAPQQAIAAGKVKTQL